MRHPRLRHADDTPPEGFAWRKTPPPLPLVSGSLTGARSLTGAGLPGGVPINAGRVSPAMMGAIAVTSSASVLVADEVLHPIGKIQPVLIGWNLP